MSEILSPVLMVLAGGHAFWCPGCEMTHRIMVRSTDAPSGPSWAWNGDPVRPTYSPSILVRFYRMSPEGAAMLQRGEKPPNGDRYPGKDEICHSFVSEGQIKFLDDCTHRLAGQTVPLPPIPGDEL